MKVDPNYVMPSGKNAKKTAGYIFHNSYKSSHACWNWQGKLFTNGYGCFYFRGKYMLAHRVSYEWFYNFSLGKSDILCHSCDNPKCVNPHHLIKADQGFNIRDMMNKGRSNHASGERHVRSKLKEKDIEQIKILRYVKKIKLSDIADIFGVSAKQISVVSRGVQWKRKKGEQNEQ